MSSHFTDHIQLFSSGQSKFDEKICMTSIEVNIHDLPCDIDVVPPQQDTGSSFHF